MPESQLLRRPPPVERGRHHAVDRYGRRYTEVGALAPARAQLLREGDPLLECADCSAPIRHGVDRYFARHVRATELVCGRCGDQAIAR